ncbi:helix-turn-helix transcriptional regulator [Methylobacterium sp. WSM2598]|uniref:helix-turn-helix transcriptional regulator n=1 Tax=Methylobacterium sp. WSM2598 TaxID=398261 RepID=UPI0009FBD33C|nr:helix-turn-helix domain-containing protein [Methylobacterium sp. WSM2598]
MSIVNAVEIASSGRLLRTPEAARYLSVSANYLEKLRVYGTGPTFIKLGRTVRYELSALDSWLACSRRRSTSDTGVRS